MLEMIRDPRYIAPLGILLGVILLSAALGKSGSGQAGAASPTGSPPTSADQSPLDARRALDLAKVRDALALYHRRQNAYPNTQNAVTTLCDQPSDAGCVLSSVGSRLPFSDGDLPYWYASDGTTYFALIARAESPRDTGQCPQPLPPELAAGPVICMRVEGAGG